MAAIGFTNQFDTKLGIFSLEFNNLDQITENKISEFFYIIQTHIDNPFKQTGKIHVYEIINQLKNLFGESANIDIDLNLFHYGVDYIESILEEWSETCEPRIGLWINSEKTVFIDQEGSVSIFQSFLNS
jgi:hypothetical protein